MAKHDNDHRGGTIRFSDGVSFSTSGDLRIEKRSDGYYVVGRGMLCPVDSRDDGERLIAKLRRTER